MAPRSPEIVGKLLALADRLRGPRHMAGGADNTRCDGRIVVERRDDAPILVCERVRWDGVVLGPPLASRLWSGVLRHQFAKELCSWVTFSTDNSLTTCTEVQRTALAGRRPRIQD